MSGVQLVREAVKKFQQMQEKQLDFGASDTEPDSVFQYVLRKAAKGVPVRVPRSARGWQLYYIPGAREAALELHLAAAEVVKTIQAVPTGERRELQQYLRGLCWR